jgi:hypothetical protein
MHFSDAEPALDLLEHRRCSVNIEQLLDEDRAVLPLQVAGELKKLHLELVATLDAPQNVRASPALALDRDKHVIEQLDELLIATTAKKKRVADAA